MARVLVVTNTPHNPPTSGYSQRVTAVISALEHAGHLVETVSIKPLISASPRNHLSSAPANLWARFRVLRRLSHTPSLSLAKWYSPKACDTLLAITKTWQPEVVVLESSYLAPYATLFNCPVIFDLHNIESQLIANYAKDRGGIIGLAAHLESRLLERLEGAIPRQAYGVATVSETDRALLGGLKGAAGAAVVPAPNGVTDEAFTVPDQLAEAEAPTAVFIGHLGWRPNIDGAKWLARAVWPLVHEALPQAKLQLIGRDPNPAVAELADAKQGISVHGNVASVFPYLGSAAVATAPLWTAGGTRLKILEALGTGTPVVATSLGALGLEALAGPSVMQITDNPADFAAALLEYLNAPAKSRAARNAAEPFRWHNTLTGLVEMVDNAAGLSDVKN